MKKKKKDKSTFWCKEISNHRENQPFAMVGRQFRTSMRENRSFIFFFFFFFFFFLAILHHLLDWKMVSDQFWMIYSIAESPHSGGTAYGPWKRFLIIALPSLYSVLPLSGSFPNTVNSMEGNENSWEGSKLACFWHITFYYYFIYLFFFSSNCWNYRRAHW